MASRYAPLAFILLSTIAQAQYWTLKAPFPSTAEASYSFSIEGRMFAGGGLSDVAPATEYTGLNEYIHATDSWEPRSPLPAARYGVGGFSLNGKGYVACGWHLGSPQLNDVWEYDPIADSWTQKGTFPGAARYSTIAVATSSKAYMGLGYTPYANDWWEYDAASDTWTQKAPFPMIGRQAASAFVIDDQVYVGLGARDVTALSATLYNDWYRYDPVSDTWTAIATFPAAPRIGAYAFSSNGIGYVFCGAGLNGTTKVIYNDGWAYDPVNDQWLMLGLFPGVPMNAGFTFTSGTSAYFGTGCSDLSGPDWVPVALTDAFWEYKPGGIAGVGEGAASNAFTVFQEGDDLVIVTDGATTAGTIGLFDALGRMVRPAVRITSGTERIRINVSAMAAGLYIVRYDTGDRAIGRRVLLDQ